MLHIPKLVKQTFTRYVSQFEEQRLKMDFDLESALELYNFLFSPIRFANVTDSHGKA